MSRMDRPEHPQPPTPSANAATAPNILGHYLELARLKWRLIVGVTLAAGLIAALMGMATLVTSPIYRASAKVSVQPTDAELSFTQVYVRSSNYDTSNVVTQSHMEYLLSREIAERVYQTLTAENAGGGQPRERGAIATALSQVKLAMRATYSFLNSGSFVRVTGPDAMIGEIQESIEVNLIESSFIMEIAVYWNDPATAAQIANILAQVFQDRTGEQAADASARLNQFLDAKRQEAQDNIDALVSNRTQMLRSWGVIDYQTERTNLLTRIATEEAGLDTAKARLRSTEALISTFGPRDSTLRRQGLDDVTERELAQARVDLVEITQNISERQVLLNNLRSDLNRYASYERVLNDYRRELDRLRTRLADINERLLTVQMNEAETIERLRLISAAQPPLYPFNPKVVKQTVIGLMAGLILACGLILGRDMISNRMLTCADLREATGTAPGVKVLDARAVLPKGAPWMGWNALDYAAEIVVLDIANAERAEHIARDLLRHTDPDTDIWCGVAHRAMRPGYLSPGLGAILVTLGRNEHTGAALAEDIEALRRRAPAADIAVLYVDHITGPPVPKALPKPAPDAGPNQAATPKQPALASA